MKKFGSSRSEQDSGSSNNFEKAQTQHTYKVKEYFNLSYERSIDALDGS